MDRPTLEEFCEMAECSRTLEANVFEEIIDKNLETLMNDIVKGAKIIGIRRG